MARKMYLCYPNGTENVSTSFRSPGKCIYDLETTQIMYLCPPDEIESVSMVSK